MCVYMNFLEETNDNLYICISMCVHIFSYTYIYKFSFFLVTNLQTSVIIPFHR